MWPFLYVTKGISREDIIAFIGIRIYMGVHKLPSYNQYWDTGLHRNIVKTCYNIIDRREYGKEAFISNSLNVLEYYIPNDSLDNRQIEYDNKLLVTEDGGEVREIVDNILRLYRENDSMRLIKG